MFLWCIFVAKTILSILLGLISHSDKLIEEIKMQNAVLMEKLNGILYVLGTIIIFGIRYEKRTRRSTISIGECKTLGEAKT